MLPGPNPCDYRQWRTLGIIYALFGVIGLWVYNIRTFDPWFIYLMFGIASVLLVNSVWVKNRNKKQ